MKASFEKFEKYALEKDQMSKITGGEHYELVDGKWVLVPD
jgi:hypothetical protein